MTSTKLTTAEAIKIQEKLRARVIERTTFDKVELVGGVDVSVRKGVCRAAVVTLTFPGLEIVDHATAAMPSPFPYVPGLLAFREVPVIIKAFEKLKTSPDVLIVDGQGIAHPRQFGVASHLGVELDKPAIGCAKSRLVGEHKEPGIRRGAKTALKYKGDTVGFVMRTREGVKPVFISIGHRISLEDAARIVMRCVTKYRLPEPVRAAHRIAGEAW